MTEAAAGFAAKQSMKSMPHKITCAVDQVTVPWMLMMMTLANIASVEEKSIIKM